MGVQSARLLCEDPESSFAAVYATCGVVNEQYIRTLGADRVFDYNDPKVVEKIVDAAKDDGLVMQHCFLAMGQLALCQAVLKASSGLKQNETEAIIASAPPIPADAEKMEGVRARFVQLSMDSEEERLAQFRSWMAWLQKALIKRHIQPSPGHQVVGRGLEAINGGLNGLREGISCTKLVVEIKEI